MGDRHGEHWFDRLAAPHTRAEALRLALGAAALTLPLRVAPEASAAREDNCTKGCIWAANQRLNAVADRCFITSMERFLELLPLEILAFGVAYQKVGACSDRAVLENRAACWDCVQPGCPGFDPKAPGGPCEGCPDNCCACAAVKTGYICCTFACDDPTHNCCPA